MRILNNPGWLNQFEYPYENFEEIPETVFEKINTDLDRAQSQEPLVSVVITAWNEEVNILRCVASLSRMKTKHPFEIIVVNNNSTDKTQDTLNKLRVKSFMERTQGAGPARQLGQEKASGKYILTADADCFYPTCWIDEMMKVLQQPNVVCVYGRYSFISEPGFPRWKLAILESMKDMIAEVRHIKRPYFNAFGISMGYVKEYGLKIGFIKINRRGEDGQLCLDLMQYGKVKQVRSNAARAWTGTRTLQRSGNFFQALNSRISHEIGRFFNNFHSRLPKEKEVSKNA
ncbi:glycosyltransferase family 2 protein [Adhaeribacter swui]|uniref:Glycosyltransferase family 2 protein n=1 Tax=Adhaeribacter swui TaxID=2086471 RepID=A0A7G7G5B8_9BACT|nr:glycosyltransferase family 2 protein [Adhaeribacter swui]QNF32352.1 glycosyltransferase family 2 protein [Adhaeribacter swui]